MPVFFGIVRRVRVALAFLALGATSCEPAPRAETPQQPPVAAAPSANGVASAATPTATRANAGFRSRQRLSEHFEKHGAEFGSISQEEYLRLAQTLRDAPVGGDVLEIRRDDGTISRFDRKSGAFIAFDSDATIRTFFRPNDGEAYFQRQARRRSN